MLIVREVLVFAAAAVAVALVGACGVRTEPAATSSSGPTASAPQAGAAPAATASADAQQADSAVSAVDLRTGASTVSLRAADGPGYTVRRTVHPAGAAPAASSHLDGTALVLEDCDLPRCWFDYEVSVPPSAALTGEAGSGAVTVNGLSRVELRAGSAPVELTGIGGPVRVESGSGAVRLAGVTGDVQVRSGSGAVQGDGLEGTRTEVTTASGGIDLRTVSVQSVRAESGSGAVRLAVAPGSYRVATRTGGTANVALPDDPAAAATIDVRSASGAVAVHPGG